MLYALFEALTSGALTCRVVVQLTGAWVRQCAVVAVLLTRSWRNRDSSGDAAFFDVEQMRGFTVCHMIMREYFS